MDREVPEQSTGLGDVRLVRRRGIVAGQTDGVERAQRRRLDQPVRLRGSRRRTGAGSRAGTGCRTRSISAAMAMVSSRLPASGFSQNVGIPCAMPSRISSAMGGRGGGDDDGVCAVEGRVDRRGGIDAGRRARPRRPAPRRRRRGRPRRCPRCRAAGARGAGRCGPHPISATLTRPSRSSRPRTRRLAAGDERGQDASPDRGRLGRRADSCGPARPSASRRSHGRPAIARRRRDPGPRRRAR